MNIYINKRTGRIYEFVGITRKEFWLYLLRKTIAWFIDTTIIIAIIFGLTIFVKSIFLRYIVASLFGVVISSIYSLVCFVAFKNMTIGMKLTALLVVYKDGKAPLMITKITRSIVFGMNFLPVVGLAIVFVSIFMNVFNKGVSLIDLWCKISIITFKLENEFISEESKQLEKEKNKNEIK